MPFSPKTLDFLMENRLKDSRTWFQEHRGEFQEWVIKPMSELVLALSETIDQIDPQLVCEPKVGKSLSRVYRDTRFSHDKSLYREVMWCVFTRDKKAFPCSPALVFEFSPDGFRYGCGYYDAPVKTMEAVRALILENDKSFRDALKAYRQQDLFALEGECYKRSRHPGEPDWKRDWLDRRNMAFMHNSRDFELLFSQRLPGVLAEGFLTLKPIYRFFCKAEERV